MKIPSSIKQPAQKIIGVMQPYVGSLEIRFEENCSAVQLAQHAGKTSHGNGFAAKKALARKMFKRYRGSLTFHISKL